ncbi:putative mitochondrial hypothetical protein [Leptomonas pyrrhocoris]|uniref:Uncharacterized protein n=1 Tax=Leptomonas pyrrhocoris TaxID=157538 RepID=A0A0N0VGW0_LEPPY|nr:putative mitochondrial hypothetical protein [Leptomonas pyrrhocoris]KPA84501.1 putative mitochondrial hypothetical protein [Leptomonas pyrrhocoris]|eukprot:XP_015662940.1 putative mitochondrial hypothetical protein [Leptomonas pyrrhocoris]
MSAPPSEEAATAKPRRSVANYTEAPKKNPYLVKFSRFYSTKIPMGVREFVVTGPLLLITFAIAYFIPYLVPAEQFTQGLTPHKQDMLEYTLEPFYDAHGQLKGYRHINHNHAGDGSNEAPKNT